MAPWIENGNVVEFLKLYPDTYCVHLVSLQRTDCHKFKHVDNIAQALDIIQGLEHLHSMTPSIIHGDLKGVSLARLEDL